MARKASRKSARKTARKSARKSAKRSPRKTSKGAARKSARRASGKMARKSAPRRSARKPGGARRSSAKAAAPRAAAWNRNGVITHTELASSDPDATKAWCREVLGWSFGPSMPTPGGPYHMWRFANETGGGIRANNPPEVPGSIPYVEVKDIDATYEKALAAGGAEMMSPTEIPGGMGWIAIVAAPGGPAIGFWAMSRS